MENLVGFAFGGNCWRDCRDLALKYKKKKKEKKGNGLEAKMQHKPPVLFTLMVFFFFPSVLEKHITVYNSRI